MKRKFFAKLVLASLLSSSVVDAVKAQYPEIAAALVPKEQAIDALQATIDGLIAQGLWVEDGLQIGQGGNEGHSEGAHIDMRVLDNGRAVNLFGWVDAYHQGIEMQNVDLGNNKTMSGFIYDRSLNVFTYADSQIAIIRDPNGDNLVYAIENNNIGRQVMWDPDHNAWFAWIDGSWFYDSNGKRLKWTDLGNNNFDFIPV